MSDTDSSFPSITFPATFEGTAAIGADFSATMKFKTSNGPKVLEDLKALPRGTYDMTIVSRQSALAGDSVDREWAEMTLLDGDASELVYEKTCLGARCPVFAVHSSGEFEGRYVCEDAADAETYMEVVHGETHCPRFAVGDAGDDGVDELPIEDENTSTGESADNIGEEVASEPHVSVVIVLYPDDDEPHVTKIGEHTRYGKLVADYFTAAGLNGKHMAKDWTVVAEDELTTAGGGARKLRDVIAGADYGKRLLVVAADQGSVTGVAKAEEPAA